jgi:ribonuclease D
MEAPDAEFVFSRLVILRRDIAEIAGVVPRGIISDTALRKISNAMPNSEIDLKKISGLSQIFVQKYAKVFLQELKKIRTQPKEHKVSKLAQDTLTMIQQGYTFDDLQKRLFGGNKTMAANCIIELLEADHYINRKLFLDEKIYTKVKSAYKKKADITTKELQAKFEEEIDKSVIKMTVSFVRFELRHS